MPIHLPQWTDFLQCSQCSKEFSTQSTRVPYTLLCGHLVCIGCTSNVRSEGCRHEPNTEKPNYLSLLPANSTILKVIQYQNDDTESKIPPDPNQLIAYLKDSYLQYQECNGFVEGLAIYLRDIKKGIVPQSSVLTKPMLRKVVSLIQSQIVLEDGRLRALRSCHAIAERAATELILAHQNPATLSGNLWTAVRARGCQFLGPAMQEEALKLILLALEDGSELSRKVLVMFVVQKLQQQFPQASKTSIGHVVQLLYRASCFVVKKRDRDSSLMKLKEVFRTYQALRREHDAQVVQIAREAGLRIAPDQWSALLYGDQEHKSHMQSIIDRLQSGETFRRCIQDLENVLQKSNNSQELKSLIPHFEVFVEILDEASEQETTMHKGDWKFLLQCLKSIEVILKELVYFSKNLSADCWRDEEALAQSAKFKTSFCRDMKSRGRCPRGASCTFAHTDEELHRYRNKRKKASLGISGSYSSPQRPKSPDRTAAIEESSRPSMGDENQKSVQAITPVPSERQGEVGTGHPNYFHQQFPTGYMHPSPSQPHPGVLANTPPDPSQHPTSVPPIQYRQPMPPNFYHYDPYSQQNPYQTQQRPMPYMHNVPPQSLVNQASANLATGDHIALKAGNIRDPNMPQFTVTLSFQSSQNQNTSQQQSSGKPQSTPNAVHPHFGTNAPAGAVNTHFRTNTPGPVMQANVPGQMSARPVSVSSTQVPRPTAPHPRVAFSPEQVPGFYPIQPQPDHSNFITPQPGPHAEQTMLQQFHAGGDPRVAVVAPQPVIPSPAPTPTHIYDPTLFPQNSPIAPNMANPVLLGPSPSPAVQQPNQPVYIPVVRVPVAQYQVIDQPPPMQMQVQGDKSSASPVASDVVIPKSIYNASVQQLEKRKEQILKMLIQNSRKEEAPVASSTPDKYYDVWKCESCEPFLTFATSCTKDHLQGDESPNNSVDVLAELDTRTKQVTVRGIDHINPSHARNERTLDDEKMHQMLRQKNSSSTPTSMQTFQPTTARINTRSCPQEDEDDIIPFSDRPTVSKYGPIARSARTRPSNSDLVQVNANADVNTRPVAASFESPTGSQNHEDSGYHNVYSSFESLHAVSCFPAHNTMTREVSLQNPSRNHPSVHSIGAHSADSGEISLTQAASNTQLLRREQVALQQNQAQADMEDLELTTELQQIELSIQRKKHKQHT